MTVEQEVTFVEEAQARWSRLAAQQKTAVKDHAAGLQREYDALVQVGLLDEEKIERFMKAVGAPDPADLPEVDAQALEKAALLDKELMLTDQLYSQFDIKKDCFSVVCVDAWSSSNTYKSSDPLFHGGVSTYDSVNKVANRLQVRLVAYGGYTTQPHLAQADCYALLRFKIPGQHIPYGRIAVTPYLNVSGLARVFATGTYPPQMAARTGITVSTRLGQAVAPYPYPWVKTLTQFTKPIEYFAEKAPPMTAYQGYHTLHSAAPLTGATSTADVVKGQDVYFDVEIHAQVRTVSGMTVAALYCDGSSFIDIPMVCLQYIYQYSDMIAKVPPWYERLWDLSHVPLDELKPV